MLTTGVFENTFYADSTTLVQEALEVFDRIAAQDCPLFAKMIVYARNEGLLRTVPITALAVLSRADSELFGKAFPLVIRTPNDLKDFVTLVRKGSVRGGLGRSVKRAVNDWMNGLTEYHAIKYGSRSGDVALRDVLRITHPKPKDDKADALFHYLVNGLMPENSDSANSRVRPVRAERVQALLPQVWAFEQLKRADAPEDRQRLIAEGRLPYEAIVGAIAPDAELWGELMKQMPYMALLRHINTLTRAGVLADCANADYVAERLTNCDAVAKSKVLPFRFFSAHKTLTAEVPRRVTEAVEEALELSFANMPTLPGVTCIAPDVSGSMACGLVSGKGTTRFIDIAAVFAAACLKKSKDALVLPFEHRVVEVRLSSRDTLMTTADKLAKIGGGGTAVGAPISHLLEKQIKVDTFIGITDNEDWCYGWDGRTYSQFATPPAKRPCGEEYGFLNAWRKYKRKVNGKAKAFLLTIAPYQHAVAPQNEPDVWFVYGWSDAVLPYIARTVDGATTQMEAVRAISLESRATRTLRTPEFDESAASIVDNSDLPSPHDLQEAAEAEE
ncbi:MAG: TROVE domain-containing protein [Armatimonadetes bacterium]|nr:TROVE domain-containing protein [Armatimonadota bacterium]